jgi:hypothetical protein
MIVYPPFREILGLSSIVNSGAEVEANALVATACGAIRARRGAGLGSRAARAARAECREGRGISPAPVAVIITPDWAYIRSVGIGFEVARR